jgi:hypothetical protein
MIHIPIFFRIGDKEGEPLEGMIEHALEDKVIVEPTSNDHILQDGSQCQSCPKDSRKAFIIK